VKLSKFNLPSFSIDELWALHEEVGALLSKKITQEENRSLASDKTAINRAASQIAGRRPIRRKYPPVLPKFQNPSDPTETWAGRGKQPRWLVAQLKAGKKINDFLIDRVNRRRA